MRSDQLLYVGQIFNARSWSGTPDNSTRSRRSMTRGGGATPTARSTRRSPRSSTTTPTVRFTACRSRGGYPRSCAPLVSDAFYPTMPFEAGTTGLDRHLEVKGPNVGAVDEAIVVAADSRLVVPRAPGADSPSDRQGGGRHRGRGRGPAALAVGDGAGCVSGAVLRSSSGRSARRGRRTPEPATPPSEWRSTFRRRSPESTPRRSWWTRPTGCRVASSTWSSCSTHSRASRGDRVPPRNGTALRASVPTPSSVHRGGQGRYR